MKHLIRISFNIYQHGMLALKNSYNELTLRFPGCK
jgi:hypothetical protein